MKSYNIAAIGGARPRIIATELPDTVRTALPERLERIRRRLFGLIWIFVICAPIPSTMISTKAEAAESHMLAYIGGYTGPKSKGIYVSRFDTDKGQLSAPELAVETESPSFLALDPHRHFLYAVGEVNRSDGKPTGSVSAFSMDTLTGKLTLLNRQSSGGAGPCHLAVDQSGKCVIVANYGNGSVAALPISENGKLGEPSTVIQHQGSSADAKRQEGPHAHCITIDPANRYALACDLGLDKVLVYRVDPSKAALVVNDPPSASIKPGSGPRHLAFHPNGRVVFVVNEMSSTLTALRFDPGHGVLTEVQTISTVPENFHGDNTCAEVQVHPSGRFVYGSNRGHDSIAVFGVDLKTSQIKPLQHEPTQGKTPRHFAIDPSGKWLLAENQASDSITLFSLNPKTGLLTPTGQKVDIGGPVCIVFASIK